MLKRLSLFFLLLIPCLMPVNAKETLVWCLDNFVGFHEFKDDVHQPVGPSVNLMLYLSEQLDLNLEMTPPTPAARCFEQIKTGKADVMTNLIHTPERELIMDFVEMAERYSESLIVLNNTIKTISADNFITLNIATIRAHRFTESIEALLNANPVNQDLKLPDFDNALAMLKKRRIDGVLAPTVVAATLISIQSDQHLYQLVHMPKSLSGSKTVHIGVSKKTQITNLARRLDKAIKTAKQSSMFRQLYDQHKIDRPLNNLNSG
ncbi:hypothetical protein PALB_24660 [Pseudoalteromonas luteoviolacea B = ATCC 29581]|nr:hypothetical protein PALB_24660 [Pseudoalteromonas luteoviolacea B = ATCC 29581]